MTVHLEERLAEREDSDVPRILRGFTTRAVHAGERPERPEFTPTVTPIYPSVSYLADDPETQDAVFGGEQQGYVYTRHGNPTTRALEVAVAALEETEDAVAFGSGMAALLAAILNEVQAGDRVVASRDLYGATQALLGNVFGTLGVRTTYVDILDLDAVERVLAEVRPRVLLFETISNPLVRVADIPALVEIARRNRVKTIVDNTFATPLLVNPARFGVDTVVHSTTKYLGGHGDATGGVVATTRDRALEIGELTKLTGAVLGPFEAWLTLRGVKTLSLRMQRQCENAAALAHWLARASPHHAGLLPRHRSAGRYRASLQWRPARWHRRLRHRGRGARRGLLLSAGAAHLPAGDDPRRRLHDGALPSAVDPPHAFSGGAVGRRHRRRTGASLGRDRRRGRSDRGSGSGAGVRRLI